MKVKRIYSINQKKCISCGTCDVGCPQGAILISGEGKFSINYEKCVSCGICFRDCPIDAIEKREE
ncbi:MAG TPA: 4Fe-4S binding protein [Bacillota bacterium]|nr:4Fe-4S binding protein [Clostridiales bacterium]HPT84479.1 4Fe-4S binding protein [Bacillota bacterium]